MRGPRYAWLVIVAAVLAAITSASGVPVTEAVAGAEVGESAASVDVASVARAHTPGRFRPSAPVPAAFSGAPASPVTGESRFTPDESEQSSPRLALRLRFSRRGPPPVAA